MSIRLISISEAFKQYELAIQTKNHDQIRIWHKNFDVLLDHLIKDGYKNLGLNYDSIYNYIIKFLEQNQGSKYIDIDYVKNKILKIWPELECVDILTKF